MHGVKLKNLNASSAQTAEPDPSETIFSQPAFNQPSTSKGTHDFLEEAFCFDMKMMGDIGAGLGDSLGDMSMDSYTDLSGILTQTFTGEPEDMEQEVDLPLTLIDLDAEMKTQQYSFKRSFEEMEDPSSDLGKLSASVGLTRSRTPSLDHDYSAKRPRLSPSPTPATAEVAEEPFLVPDLSPASSPAPSSPSSDVYPEDKKREQREKNNSASKRSREVRKQKFLDMEVEAERLTTENDRLEKHMAELEKLAKHMKEILVAKLKIT